MVGPVHQVRPPTPAPGGWRRRDVLALLAAAAAVPVVAACGGDEPRRGPAPAYLGVVAAEVRAGEPALGPAEALDELDLGDVPTDEAGWEALAAGLRQRVRADFAAGRTLRAAGWLLARTEALLAVAAG